jgi:hypothetical protein
VPARVVEPSRRPLQRARCRDVAHGDSPVVGMRAVRLKARSRPVRGVSTGFTLLEVVVAGGILLLTIAAVTLCVVNVSRAGARLERSMDADRAVRRVAQRLRLLPFCSASFPRVAAEPGAGQGDLVSSVFPHADPAQNTPVARYVASAGEEGPVGSFVTLLLEDGVQIRCVARFLAAADGPELGVEAMSGWDALAVAAPPSPTLSLTLSTAGNGRIVRFSRSALSGAPGGVQPTAGAGG